VNFKASSALNRFNEAVIGHIRGAFGTIPHGDIAPRQTWKHRLATLLAPSSAPDSS